MCYSPFSKLCHPERDVVCLAINLPFFARLLLRAFGALPYSRIAEDEPEKVAIKANGLFFQEKEKRLSEANTSRLPNPMFPVSRRELAPDIRDI